MESLSEKENQRISYRQIDALRLYGGDTRVRCSNGYMGTKSKDAIYGDKNAYRTLNALLFESNKNEQERIWKEGHTMNPEFIRRIEETVQVYRDIFTLMKVKNGTFDYHVTGKRIDRVSSVVYYESGFTQSFFSCSKRCFDSEFSRKNGIILIEVELSPNIPFIDYESVLRSNEYTHWDEREILLPPFLNIELEEIPLTIAETRMVRDKEKKPPLGKYQLKTIKFPDYRKAILYSQKLLWQQIIDGKESAAKLLEKMNGKEKEQDYREYICWKEKLQEYLKIEFSQIWYGGGER